MDTKVGIYICSGCDIGKTLDIDGHSLTVGDFSTRKLSDLTTIFARYVDTEGVEDEQVFLLAMQKLLLEKPVCPSSPCRVPIL